MKMLLLCYSLLLPILGISQTEVETTIESKITRVTVYLNGAQVTRAATFDLPKGTSSLVFKNLSTSLDPSTIQVRPTGDFIILSVNHRLNYKDSLVQPRAVQKLKDELLVIKDSIQYLQTLQAIVAEEASFLQATKPNNKSDEAYDADSYRAAAQFYAARIRSIKIEELNLNRQVRVLKDMFQQQHKQLNEIMGQECDYPSEIIVKVQAVEATTGDLSFSYTTPNASWTPTYDLKVATVAQPIQMLYKSTVKQSTGEDWKEVILTFSNADPTKSGVVPNLNPDYLSFGRRATPYTIYRNTVESKTTTGPRTIRGIVRAEGGEPLIGATISVRGASTGTITDFNGAFEYTFPEGTEKILVSYTGYDTKEITLGTSDQQDITLDEGSSLEEVVVTKSSGLGALRGRVAGLNINKSKKEQAVYTPPSSVTRKTTSVEFELDIPYTVNSDQEDYTINLVEKEIPATYIYQTVPKLEETAYLTAKIVDWADYDLLSGVVNLYFEDTFVGKSNLDLKNISDTLQVSLGEDKSVQIQRIALKEFKKRTFIGNKQKDSRAYKIVVRNNKKETIQINVIDQIPVSTYKEINIEDSFISKGNLNENTGEVKWNYTLTAQQEKELTISYSVKYPKNRSLILD